jgi:hypothetical protein
LGGSFDPKNFELDEANESLTEYAEVAGAELMAAVSARH